MKYSNLLEGLRTVAIIGLSNNPQRESYKTGKCLQALGIRVIPINPNISKTLDEKAYPNLTSIPGDIKIDAAVIFRKSEEIMLHLEEVLTFGGIKSVWLPQGVDSKKAEDFAKQHHLSLVNNFCIINDAEQ